MILDDVLTGLDRATEQNILEAVFAPTGILKQLGTTVVLATNSGNLITPLKCHVTKAFSSSLETCRQHHFLK